MPPTHLMRLMRQLAVNASSYILAHTLMNGSQQLVQYAPSVFPAKKVQVLSHSHAQNELKLKIDHPQRISRVLVAISNTAHIALWRYIGWLI